MGRPGGRVRIGIASLALVLLAACASAPSAPAPGRAAAWGYVRLVPREGVTIHAGSASYGDREVADAVLVDYSKPGFAVVWADGAAPPATAATLAIRNGVDQAVFDPPHVALGAGSAITVTNDTAEPHLLSCPRAGLVRRLAAGQSVAIAAAEPGEWPLFLLDAANAGASAFAAPGPFQVVSSAGRFALSDLAPGPTRLHAWHPRFPAAATAVDLASGRATRVDLELRVDAPEGARADAP